MFASWKRNVLFETAVLFAERWRHLTYSNELNFINNALLVAKEYFHFKLSNVTKRATVACASVREAHCQQASTAVHEAHCL